MFEETKNVNNHSHKKKVFNKKKIINKLNPLAILSSIQLCFLVLYFCDFNLYIKHMERAYRVTPMLTSGGNKVAKDIIRYVKHPRIETNLEIIDENKGSLAFFIHEKTRNSFIYHHER